MFARNLKNPRTAEPELDKNSLGFPWHRARLLIMEISRKSPNPFREFLI
jgi:hypothetical protein